LLLREPSSNQPHGGYGLGFMWCQDFLVWIW
jgi:hypothetical protein